MIGTQDSGESSSSERPLPPQFEKIEDILDMPKERLLKNPLVNVIGLVKDYQPPIPTKGSDYKCSLTVVDLSTQYGIGTKVIIFWPRDRMPHISGVCDVVLLRKFKVQMWSGYVSLLANWASDVQVFPASEMPQWPVPSSFQPRISSKGTPSYPVEAEYAVWLFHRIDRAYFPNAKVFQENAEKAMSVKVKYCLLKDIKAEHFYDLVGEVIRVYEKDGRVTLYLSDYTAHPLFYNNEWKGDGDNSSARDGDEYGYTKARKKATNDWPGPYGKLSLQITAYDSHAAYIRERVKNQDWVILKNVHVKMGNQGGCLEGFLRGDRGAWEDKVQVQIIRRAEDAERNDVRWKEGLRRKREWWDRFKKQKQRFLEEAQESGTKRKLGDTGDSRPNGKQRRKEMRVAAEQKALAAEKKVTEKLGLNSNVKCNYSDKPPVPLAKILTETDIMRSDNGTEYTLPFENVKYRSNVRVVDFWPNKLEDFAVGRRVSEYEVLSDYSGGESTDNEEDMRLFRQGKGYGGEKTWEWRFALRVEDASKKAGSQEETIWLVVDNPAAQMLLNMDAVNLRQDKETLSLLREVLFRLWGDLEEMKSAYLKKQNDRAVEAADSMASKPKAPSRKPGDYLPPDSDDENSPEDTIPRNLPNPVVRKETPPKIDSETNPSDTHTDNADLFAAISSLPVTNKAFTCCIQQYGIQVPAGMPSKADAGDGMAWKRVFGLFGTAIA